jgi:glutathione S-transferase
MLDFHIRRGLSGRSPEFPVGTVPVLTFPDGNVIAESTSISRYAAKLANLYPADSLEALFVDEVVEIASDVIQDCEWCRASGWV